MIGAQNPSTQSLSVAGSGHKKIPSLDAEAYFRMDLQSLMGT